MSKALAVQSARGFGGASAAAAGRLAAGSRVVRNVGIGIGNSRNKGGCPVDHGSGKRGLHSSAAKEARVGEEGVYGAAQKRGEFGYLI
jgi:hypothetical protein